MAAGGGAREPPGELPREPAPEAPEPPIGDQAGSSEPMIAQHQIESPALTVHKVEMQAPRPPGRLLFQGDVEGELLARAGYDDRRQWAFHLQVFFLGHRAQQHLTLAQQPHSAIADRSIYEDAHIFARVIAIACLEMLDALPVTEEHLKRGLAEVDWPARLQRLTRGPLAGPYTPPRAHETVLDHVCRLLLEKKKHRP